MSANRNMHSHNRPEMTPTYATVTIALGAGYPGVVAINQPANMTPTKAATMCELRTAGA